MTLLTICEGLAKNVGMEVPDVVITSSKREWKEAVNLSNMVGEELARRVDWGALWASVVATGDGTSVSHALGSFFSRIVDGVAVKTNPGNDIIRPLTRAEWWSVTPTIEGTPRYYLLEGKNITFYPFLANGSDAVIGIQTRAWCSNTTAMWATDTDTSLIDEDLMLKGLIVRWRRQKGMDFADYEAEYEATLSDMATFDVNARV